LILGGALIGFLLAVLGWWCDSLLPG